MFRLSHVSFEIEMAQGGMNKVEMEDKEFEAKLRKNFKSVFFANNQINLIEIEGNSYYVKVFFLQIFSNININLQISFSRVFMF